MSTGDRMKQKRKQYDIPVPEIAKALGCSVASVYRYENGEIEKVPGQMLEPLAKVLHTTVAYLMGWDESDEPTKAPKAMHDRLDLLNESNQQKVSELIDLYLSSQSDRDSN